ncbi:MAG: phosphoglucosamine mutase [Crocinitomicaceae bacterium]|nr:phosphoglucosamine mutase [Crocinitomicaceae bacterium]|tara:strand:+ start:8772 stop:10157 length:1386 start_codon:yes stop_codon:yes gene_type:complete
MTLIKSISGIRGTIGGKPNENLTPIDIVESTAAFGSWVSNNFKNEKIKIVIGRDARISGKMVENLCIGTLQSLGIDVINLGLSTTPTVEIAVPMEKAHGGIILTASHNPKEWNALKLLNNKGEFISAEDGQLLLEIIKKNDFNFCEVDMIGKVIEDQTYFNKHIEKILEINKVDINSIKKAKIKVVLDAVNSTGGMVLPKLLKALGCSDIIELFCKPNGEFPHNPEPLPEHLTELSKTVVESGADLGIVVDPDVDRLAFVCEDGSMFGEEYTLVAVADHVLKNQKGNTVSNLSSTRALRDVTESHNCEYNASAVGEVNVVKLMKKTNAIIGGEGNGGVIFPELHYGRDALIGIALFLSHYAKEGKSMTELKKSYPNYTISKNKIQLTPEINIDNLLGEISKKYQNKPQNKIDGLKIELNDEWVHLRKSNTEPIIRIYSESSSESKAHQLGNRFIKEINDLI